MSDANTPETPRKPTEESSVVAATEAVVESEDVQNDEVIGTAFRRSAVAIAVLLAAAAVVAYWMTRPPAPEESRETPLAETRPRDLTPFEIPRVTFTDVTESAGIDFVHTSGAAGRKLLPETMGSGCAFLDFDDDGDQDLLFVNGRTWDGDPPATDPFPAVVLYANDGDGSFENVTDVVGLSGAHFYGTGIACGDYDGDGFVDLYVTAVGPNHLFRNVGGERFEEVTETANVAGGDTEWGTSCGFFDADRDGDLDLFVLNYLEWSPEFDLAQNFTLRGGGRAYGRPQNFGGSFPILFRNDGNGRFSDVSEESGIRVRNPATKVPLAKSLGLAFADFNHDGLLDVVVANDTVQNLLFENRGGCRFEEIGTLSGIAFDGMGQARGAMGIDIAPFRNDESLGVVIGNFSNEMSALYVADSDVQFVDEAVANGLGPSTRQSLTFGTFFLDYDLDGRLDVFSANGHLEEDINRVQETQHYEQPPQLFWNAGQQFATEFVPVPQGLCGVDLVKPIVGRGSSMADVDGDGDLDVVITATGRRPRLLRNDQSLDHHWLRVRLEGVSPNADAIGAVVELHLEGGGVYSRAVLPTRSYLSQVELPVTFGLGEVDGVAKIVVTWPDGERQTIVEPSIDRMIVVRRGS